MAIYKFLRRTRADLLHVHGYKATILGGIVAGIANVPYVSTYHGEAAQCPDLSTYVRIETTFLKRASRIFAVSRNIQDELLWRGITQDKIFIIFNGINDPTKGAFNHRNVLDTINSIKVLCIGRLITLKRFDLVIDAIHVLRYEFPEIKLSIAGSGPMESVLKRKLNSLGLEEVVSLLGYVKETDVLYREANIFVLFSDTEGSPIVLIEAMAFSIPTITTGVGAIPDMLHNKVDAIILPTGDLDQLIQSLRFLIIHPEVRESLGKSARKSFEKRFTSNAMAIQYSEQYTDIMQKYKRH